MNCQIRSPICTTWANAFISINCDGPDVGWDVGGFENDFDGTTEGLLEGWRVGCDEGRDVGWLVGCGDRSLIVLSGI